MTTVPRSVVIGVFRDRKLAEQALEALKQTSWGVDDPQMLEKKAHGIFGALKNTITPSEAEAEPMPNELAQVDLPEEQRRLYQRELAQGSSLVVIHPQSHLLEIHDILNRYGAYHVFVPFQMGGEQTISIRQEVPQVQKQIVDIGEIRIHKRVITEERTFTVPVTREEVTIERLPLTSASQPYQQQTASEATASEYKQNVAPAPSSPEGEMLREEGTLRILVREEWVVIQKEVVVVEEIIVQKQMIQDTKHLVEPIKHEEVHIERVGKALVHETDVQEGSSSTNEMT